jgi:hypothetical protein
MSEDDAVTRAPAPESARTSAASVSVKANQRFSEDIVAEFRGSKGLCIRAGTKLHRFIGIWAVVVNDRVFVRSWSVKPRGWYRTLLEEPRGTVRIANREMTLLLNANTGILALDQGPKRRSSQRVASNN